MHWQMKGIAAGDARLACAPLAPLADSGPDPPSCSRSSKAAAAGKQQQAPASKHQHANKQAREPTYGTFAWCLLIRGDGSMPKCQRRALPGFVNWPLSGKQTEVVASSVQAPQR